MAVSFQPVDLLDEQAVSEPAKVGSGTCTATMRVIDDDAWQVGHMVVQNTSSSPTRARVYDSPALTPPTLLDGTNAGNLDIADYASPLPLGRGRQVIVVWSGVSDGAVGTVRVTGFILAAVAGAGTPLLGGV